MNTKACASDIKQGYVMIDASQPLDVVVSEIIDGAIALDDGR